MRTRGSDRELVRLTCETSDYFLDRERRGRLNAACMQEQTLRSLRPPTHEHRARRWVKIALFAALLALLLIPLTMVRAQADMDGGEDGYHPAIVEYRLGLFHLVREEWELAIARFDEAIWLLPEYAAAFEARGYCREATGNIERATADYRQAIAMEPGYGPTYKLLADLYYGQGVPGLALENYQLYVSLTGEQIDPSIIERVAELEAGLS